MSWRRKAYYLITGRRSASSTLKNYKSGWNYETFYFGQFNPGRRISLFRTGSRPAIHAHRSGLFHCIQDQKFWLRGGRIDEWHKGEDRLRPERAGKRHF